MIQYVWVVVVKGIDISKTNLYIKRIINVLNANISCNQKENFVNNRHSDAFIFVLAGSCTYNFDGYSVTVDKGDILYLSAGETYTMDIHTNQYRAMYCDFEFDGIEKRKSNVYHSSDYLYTKKLFKTLMNAFPAFFSEYMTAIYEIYGIILSSARNSYLNPSVKSIVENSKNYIDLNFKDVSLTVCALAQQANISEVYYRRIFKEKYGVAPYQYIILCRLKNAKQLMEYSFLSLEECALQSGFSSLQHFCRVFKNTYNISPGKYRKNEILHN